MFGRLPLPSKVKSTVKTTHMGQVLDSMTPHARQLWTHAFPCKTLGLPDMATLAEVWSKLPGLEERGATGRLIVGPVQLKRADLDFNWNIVGHAIVWVGTRVGIEPLTDVVEDFFHLTRCRGRPPASRDLALHAQGKIEYWHFT